MHGVHVALDAFCDHIFPLARCSAVLTPYEDALLVALDAFGFALFSKGKRLNLIYGLEYTGDLTHQQFVAALRLPDANDVAQGASHSRQSYPIARLFYTIGLAQS